MTRHHQPATLHEALVVLERLGPRGRPIAGGTDLLLELGRGERPDVEELVDLSRIRGLDGIADAGDQIVLGPLVTHNQVVSSRLIVEYALPLAQACLEIGSPALRNRATVAGNIITASPAHNTLSALTALDAWVDMRSAGASRSMPLDEFLVGFRATALQRGELVAAVRLRKVEQPDRAVFVKVGNRLAHGRSVVHAALAVSFAGDDVRDARIALGGVAPTVVRAEQAEAAVIGQPLSDRSIAAAARAAAEGTRAIGDVNATPEYRSELVRVIVHRAFLTLRDGAERSRWPERIPLLGGTGRAAERARWPVSHGFDDVVETVINGQARRAPNAAGRTLLDWLRDEASAAGATPLTGTKEGCAEGECGACTVHVDGKAVLSCLVPATCAHHAELTTIEGLASETELHPLQAAFVDCGAVQCGYRIPGFLMAGTKLLEEVPRPTVEDVRRGLAGNLCRCTGYSWTRPASGSTPSRSPPTAFSPRCGALDARSELDDSHSERSQGHLEHLGRFARFVRGPSAFAA